MPHKNMDSGFTFIRFSRRICADCRVEQFVPFMELSCVSCLARHTHTHTHTDRHEHSWHILVQTIRRLKYSQQDAGKHPGHTGHLLLPLLNVASFLPILLEPICLAYGLNVLDFAFAFYGGSYGSERIYLLAPHFAGHRLVVIKSGLTKLISNYECISKEVLFIQFLSRKFGC